MDVRVFGNVAVAQGSVEEKRSRNGKDTSGNFAWMDLLEKRAGKWVDVQSAAGRLTDSAKTQSKDPVVVDAVKQFEQEVGDAMVARDIDKLSQAYADDWVTARFLRQNLHEGEPSKRLYIRQSQTRVV